MRKAFNEWREKIPLMRRLEKITKIQNAYRTHKANKKLNDLKLRNTLLYRLTVNYDDKTKKY